MDYSYRDVVLAFSKELISQNFSHCTQTHFSAITEAMLLTARGSYKMITQDFTQDVFYRQDILTALESMFERNVFPRIKVLSVKNRLSDTSLHPWNQIAKKYDQQIDLRFSPNLKPYSNLNITDSAIIGNTGYRYTVKADGLVKISDANFYDPKTCKILDKYFEEFWNNCNSSEFDANIFKKQENTQTLVFDV